MFTIEVPGFSLYDTFMSKQSLMWDMKLTLDGVCWTVVNGDYSCKVSQVKERILVSGSEEDFFDVWFPYFDLSVDYTELDRQSRKLCAPICKASKLVHGVHMLNINPFESMLTQALWWKCDSLGAKQKLKKVCELTGRHRKRNYKEIGSTEHCFIPTYDEFMYGKELLEGVLSPRDLNMCISLYNWFKDFKCHLIASEGHSIDIGEVEILLDHSGLFKPAQVRRVMRDAYGDRSRMCAPKRMEKQVMESSWYFDPEEIDEEVNEVLHGKAAYAGLLMQSAYGV